MLNKTPLLSIIIPTYNSESTLDTALKSIFNQTFRNFEVLIIDGKSTDKTLEIVKAYNNINLRVYSEVDKGIYDAMNKGITLAKGEWLYFLGSDDSFYTEDVLDIITKHFVNNDVVYGNVFSSRFNGEYGGAFGIHKITKQNICHQAIFFNKKVFNCLGKFNLKYKSHADWHHNIKWLLSKKVNKKYVDITVANYADGGFSSVNFDEKFHRDKNLVLIKNGLFIYSIKDLVRLFLNYLKNKK